jgi:adenylate cyclase
MDRGPLVHGNVGSPTRMEYTVIGDTVNSASRVEGLTKELGAPIVFTQAVLEGLSARPGDLAELGTRTLRGRKGETRLFGVGAPVRHPLDDAGPSDPRLAKLVLTRDSDPSTSE